MSTLRISNIEAKSVPASATVDEKVKITNSSGDTLVFIDGKTSGITTVGINTTDSNITFDANSNVVVTGIITATRFSGQITPTSLEIGSNIKLGNAGVITATTFVGAVTGNVIGNISGGTVSGSTGTFTGDLSIAQNLVHTGDTDTKLSFYNDVISLDTAGIERFRIYNDGVVAIGQSSKSSTVGAGNLDIQGNATNCIIEMGNPFPTFSGGVVPEFRITATNSGHEVKFESIWGGDNLLHPHIAFTGGRTHFYRGTNSDEIARFDANRFWIGTTSGHGQFQVHDGTIVHSKPAGGGTRNYRFVNNNTAAGDYGIQISTTEAGSTYVNHTELKAGGDVHIHDGNLKLASGHGIDFSATSDGSGTDTSELLDDYEEGTWTPTIYRSNNSGVSGSYNHQEGSYVRVGRLVFALFRVDITSFSGGSGHVVMGGLPYSTHSHGVGGWTNVANMRRMYLDGDYARGVDARSLVGASGISYLYVMNLDDDQWDYGNYSRILFDGYITYQTS
jgi:hypothetical protein